MGPVDRDRAERVRRLFDEVIDLPTCERAAAFAASGEADGTVVRDVEELVVASRRAPGFLDRPAAEGELEGRDAGPWRIGALAASGGSSDVYHAVRGDADLPWRAALKVLKPGFDGAALTARFRAERRVLAALNHPNIVVLLDAGTLDDGRLYLATEFVDGASIVRHCDAAGLGLRARLDLFLRVSDAVQHAHERLVLHCDLKPSNVLVSREGIPKLLDFGVSRLLGRDGVPGEPGGPLTPGYASPEQLRGEVLAATTDVWSLGVMLYELIAGRRPYDVAGLDVDEILARTAIRPPPAARGDLGAVVRRALEPDPTRRYPSVASFATDLRRVLEHRPVAARPATPFVRAAKFVRRNRGAVAAACVVAASLVVGVLGLRRGLLGAREEARLGWRAHAQAVQVSRFLEDLIASSVPATAEERLRREALLDRAASALESSFAGHPETEGRLRLAVAKLYLDLDLAAAAKPQLGRAVALIDAHRGFGRDDRARAEALLARAAASRPRDAR